MQLLGDRATLKLNRLLPEELANVADDLMRVTRRRKIAAILSYGGPPVRCTGEGPPSGRRHDHRR
jgi:hypothetical protein